jgi:hypothetical protein
MTNTPGDDQPPQNPPNDPYQSPQPGYWEQQQAAQPGQPVQPVQPGQPGQPGYGYSPQPYGAPMQFAPDHPKATTSLVLGILGLVLCSVLAPFAWVMGKRTVGEIDASNGQLGGRGAAQAGYICGIIGTVLLGLGLAFLVVWLVIVIAAIGTAGVSSS